MCNEGLLVWMLICRHHAVSQVAKQTTALAQHPKHGRNHTLWLWFQRRFTEPQAVQQQRPSTAAPPPYPTQ